MITFSIWILLLWCCPIDFKTKKKALKGTYEIVSIHNRRHVYRRNQGDLFIYFETDQGKGFWLISDAVGKPKEEALAFHTGWSVTVVALESTNAKWIMIKTRKSLKAKVECSGLDMTMFFFADLPHLNIHGFYLHMPYENEYLWAHASSDNFIWKAKNNNRWLVGMDPFTNMGVAFTDSVSSRGHLKGEWHFLDTNGVWSTSSHIGILTGKSNTEMCNSIKHETTVFDELTSYVSLKTQLRSPPGSIGKLRSNLSIPMIGFGVEKSMETGLWNAVINSGYVLLDLKNSESEQSLGEYLKDENAILTRRSLFIQSKLSLSSQAGFEATLQNFQQALDRLHTTYLDSFLLQEKHPFMWIQNWEALQKLHEEGFIMAIGVSKFVTPLLTNSLQTTVVPHILQKHHFSFDKNDAVHVFLDSQNIFQQLRMGSGNSVSSSYDDILSLESSKYNKSTSQIMNKLLVQKDIGVIASSESKKEILEDMKIWDFKIDDADQLIQKLQKQPDTRWKDEL